MNIQKSSIVLSVRQIYATKFRKIHGKVTAVQPWEESHRYIISTEQDVLDSISITSLKQSSPLKY